MKKPVVTEFRPGAEGAIAARALNESEKDLTLMFGTIHTLSTSVDQLDGMIPVAYFGVVPCAVATRADFDFDTVKQLAHNKKPRRITAAAVSGTIAQDWIEWFARTYSNSNLEIVIVPYKSGAMIMSDLVGGHIDMTVTGIPQSLPFLQEGKIKMLGLVAEQRLPKLPNLSTVFEQGFVNSPVSRMGMWANLGADKREVDMLQQGLIKWVGTKEGKEIISQVSSQLTPQEVKTIRSVILSNRKKYANAQ